MHDPRATIRALEQMQARTAEAHALYLRTMMESHLALLHYADATMRATMQASMQAPMQAPPEMRALAGGEAEAEVEAEANRESPPRARRALPLGLGRAGDTRRAPLKLEHRSVLLAVGLRSPAASASLGALERRFLGRVVCIDAGAGELAGELGEALRRARAEGGVIRGLLVGLEGEGAEEELEALIGATLIDPLAFALVASPLPAIRRRVEALAKGRPGLRVRTLFEGTPEALAEALLGPPRSEPPFRRKERSPAPAKRYPARAKRAAAPPPPAE